MSDQPQEPTPHDAQPNGPADELEGLLEQLTLGELDPVGWRRVGDLIRDDEDAARRYVQTAHYCETLRDETTGPGEETLPTIPTTPPEAAPEPSRTADATRSGLSLAWLAPWGIAVSLAFVSGWLALQGRETPTKQVASAPRPFVLPEDAGRTEPLGRVVGLTPAASSDGLLRSLKVGSQLGRGEVFQLTRGAARLEIADAEVLVQGPAELSAIGPRTLFVRQGRVTVAPEGKMTVQTPVAIVSGEGARYAVAADAETDVVVTTLEGVAKVHSAPRRGRVGDSLGEVAAGSSMRVADLGSRRLEVDRDAEGPKGLLLAWQDSLKRLHPYEQLVLSDEPLAYWPLYRVRRHRAVLDLTQNGFDGYAIGNWPTELNDPHASQPRGAYFDGESYVESDRKPPVDLRSGFTIESWARVAGGPEYQSVFTSRWVLESNTEREQCFGFTLYAGKDDRWQFWTGSGEYARNWDKLSADQPVERSRWTHVAASFEPDPGQEDAAGSVAGVVRIFVDGVRVAEARHAMSLEDFAWPARIGAAEFVPQSLTSWLFEGELRDVALYDHVLSPERVREHSEQGRSAT